MAGCSRSRTGAKSAAVTALAGWRDADGRLGGGPRAGQGVFQGLVCFCRPITLPCVDLWLAAQGHFAAAFEFKDLSTGQIWVGKVTAKVAFKKFPAREKVRGHASAARCGRGLSAGANSE